MKQRFHGMKFPIWYLVLTLRTSEFGAFQSLNFWIRGAQPVNIYIYIFIYLYICICTHIYTHTHIHTHQQTDPHTRTQMHPNLRWRYWISILHPSHNSFLFRVPYSRNPHLQARARGWSALPTVTAAFPYDPGTVRRLLDVRNGVIPLRSPSCRLG